MLVTNCEDNISRLWCETVLPDDGLVSLTQIDPAATQVVLIDKQVVLVVNFISHCTFRSENRFE